MAALIGGILYLLGFAFVAVIVLCVVALKGLAAGNRK
jgi:hypothetical protein